MASTTASRAEPRGWAEGLASFAAFMMIIIGAFGFFEGLAALIHGDFFAIGVHYAYHIDVTAYGWFHLIWGLIVAGTGFAILAGRSWARWVGVTVLVLNCIAQFFYIPYYPIWAVLIISLCIACIWALTVYNTPDEGRYY
jgi:hypothetical protein